ncbi:hypothetical protein P7C73_g1441, partial [Tremellales sp. Uapishka_1]
MAEVWTADALNQWKIPQLKAKCKEVSHHPSLTGRLRSNLSKLKIPNFSKLNKAQFIQKILDSSTNPPASLLPFPPDTSKGSSSPNDTTKKRSKADEGKTEPSKKRAKKKTDDVQVKSLSAEKDSPPSTLRKAEARSPSVPQEPVDINTPAQISSPVIPVKSKIVPSEIKTRPVPSGAVIEKQTPALDVSLSGEEVPSSVGQPPQSVISTTQKKRTKFQPPASTRPKSSFQSPRKVDAYRVPPLLSAPAVVSLYPLSPLLPVPQFRTDKDLLENRVAHVHSHFINRLFANLYAYRTPPVLSPPYPTPIPYDIGVDFGTAALAFQGLHPVLYTRKQSTEGFQIALRFCLARLYTLMQMGSGEAWSVDGAGIGMLGPDLTMWPSVILCERVVDDVWVVETEGRMGTPRNKMNEDAIPPQGKGKEKKWSANEEKKLLAPNASSTRTQPSIQRDRYLIVASTGEVIAKSPSPHADVQPNVTPPLLIHGCEVRPDWYAFITSRQEAEPSNFFFESESESKATPPPLASCIKTKNSHDFPGGISKNWRKKMDAEEELLEIAERSVLVSLGLNSLSGTKMSALEMDAQAMGRPGGDFSKFGSKGVELYLPESRQILSIHSPPPPFHPSLAIAHRGSSTSEYVLRETGQTVGDEEGGVVEFWRGLLGCDEKGREIEDEGAKRQFWYGWVERMRGGVV